MFSIMLTLALGFDLRVGERVDHMVPAGAYLNKVPSRLARALKAQNRTSPQLANDLGLSSWIAKAQHIKRSNR